MLFGNHQHMGGRLGIDVAEGVDVFVLIHLRGGNVAGDDLAEQATGHGNRVLSYEN